MILKYKIVDKIRGVKVAMRATVQYFRALLVKYLTVTIQTKATSRHFPEIS